MLLDLLYCHSSGIACFLWATILHRETMLLDELGDHINDLGEFRCIEWWATNSFMHSSSITESISATVLASSSSLSAGFSKTRIDSKTPGVNTKLVQVYK